MNYGALLSVALGRVVSPALLLAASLLLVSAAMAQSGPTAPAPPGSDADVAPPSASSAARIGGAPAETCVEVDIAGHRAGHLDCATQRLQAATRAAQERAPNAERFAVPGATSADVVTGVANQTATRQRMGNQFGVGVRPQRPPPPVYVSPMAKNP